MLHVTNGESAARGISESGLPGDIVSWNDVLHEGPVPFGLDAGALRPVRAGFLAACGWGAYDDVMSAFERRDRRLEAACDEDEVVLWFEHDLHDQLQLVEVLARLAPPSRRPGRVTQVSTNQYLSTRSTEWFRAEFRQREPLGGRVWTEAVEAWAAFTAADPRPLVALRPQCIELSFLASAIGRHLQEFPSLQTGLSRSEGQLLGALAREPLDIVDAYHASHHDCEDAIFMGDLVFSWHVGRLSRGDRPLVTFAGDREPTFPDPATAVYWEQRICLTPLGERVLAGDEDRVATCGVDRWLGGVHLAGRRVRWRWDERHNRIVEKELGRR